ncbi:ABC transporter permease [Terrimonas sp.]|uniref:ABC transporter permease n=1 Tax=Terrimonas sp. TaxID=1914338 RepID=UPI000E325E71|nr:ABC transporter permease [Terrimonas sp.]
MIKNYLKIAWRNLLKHKIFSGINILGLSIGIAACIIIFIYVRFELTYDRYNRNADRIARVASTIKAPESDFMIASSPTALADALKQNFPEVVTAVRLDNAAQAVKCNNEVFKEEEFYRTDADIFSVFSFDFIEGNSAAALQKPQSIVLTQSVAKKYFGNTSPLGKTLVCNGTPLLVTGVVKDRPANSDIHINALLSADFSATATWDDFDLYTYVLFRQNADIKNFEKKLTALAKKNIDPLLNTDGSTGYSAKMEIEPLSDVHFSQGKLMDTPKGNKQSNYIFALLAVFILMIAILNYINLSTARSFERAKEVGIRKVSGAGKFQLVRQFLFESFLLVTGALLLSVVLVKATLPFLNTLLQTRLSVDPVAATILVAVIFVTTLLLAGLYPAFVLSGFNPVSVLKGSWRFSIKAVWLRKSITIAQFTIAIVLIVGTIVIHQQMKFIREKDLGFSKDQLLNIFLPRDSVYQGAVKAFQNDLRRQSAVKGVTVGYGMADATLASTYTSFEGKKREILCTYYVIDDWFLPVFQMHLLEGRNLSNSIITDKNEAFLVNESFLRTMGWQSGVGKDIEGFGHKGKVVGVVKDFYFKSLHNTIEPLVMIWNTFPANTTTVKISPANLSVVESIFKRHFPATVFDYAFVDDTVNKQYMQDNITMRLFNWFTVFAIFISCLGIYGLATLIIAQRAKELSVRKVLGATISQLLALLTKDYIKLLAWAMIIALPLAGYLMHHWLLSYAYRIQLSWWMFVVPVVFLLIITLVMIGREVIKAALVNPVKGLRAE